MSYQPTNWKDRVVQNARTYKMQENDDGTVTLIPAPGEVTEAGTPVDAARMNKIEQGIADTSEELEVHVDSSSVHGANPNAVANRIIIRDGAGRASIADPVAEDGITNKRFVESQVAQAETSAKNYADQQAEAAERNAKRASVNRIA